MRYIKNIKEAFNHKWSKNDDLILPIWNISENDLFDAFSDLEDDFEVEISCEFFLKSPKDHLFNLKEENKEIIESYAAAGFEPIIQVKISSQHPLATTGDMRAIQSTMMDCIMNLDGYYLSHVSKFRNYFNIQLMQEKDGNEKIKYHKKSNVYFSKYAKTIKDLGYKFIINKLFVIGDKKYIKLPEKFDGQKVYIILIEKEYANPIDINLIDNIYEVKNVFQSIESEISNSKDFKSTNGQLEINNEDGKVIIRFILRIVEE